MQAISKSWSRILQQVFTLLLISFEAWLLTSCSTIDGMTTRLRSRQLFVATTANPNVRYMPGSEAFAQRIAAAIGESLEIVERTHQAKFLAAPIVFVCRTDCILTYTTEGPQTPATKFGDCIFMNEDILVQREKERGRPPENYLTHELAHLLLYQHVGAIGFEKIPIWFTEGLAVSVSNGDVTVSAARPEAARAILAGNTFDPAETGSFFDRATAKSYKIEIAVFYREAEMFVLYLRDQDPAAFQVALNQLMIGEDFQTCFCTPTGNRSPPIGWDL